MLGFRRDDLTNRLQRFNQGRNILVHNLPENIEVNRIVAMNQTIAQAYNLRPGNLGNLFALGFGSVICCLADDF